MSNQNTQLREQYVLNDEEQAELGRAERIAAKLGRGKHLDDFLDLIPSLQIGRRLALQASGGNSVQSRGYAQAFSRWFATRPKLSSVLKDHDVTALLWLGEPGRLDELRALLTRLTPYERSRINTPASAAKRLRESQAEHRGETKLSTGAIKLASQEQLRRLQDDLAAAEAHIEAGSPDATTALRDHFQSTPLGDFAGAIVSLPQTPEIRSRLFAIGEHIRIALDAGGRARGGATADVTPASSSLDGAVKAALGDAEESK